MMKKLRFAALVIMTAVLLSGNVQAAPGSSDGSCIAAGKTSLKKVKPKLKKKYYKWKHVGEGVYRRKVRISWNKVSGASACQVWVHVPYHEKVWWKELTVKKNQKRYFTVEQFDFTGDKKPWGQDVWFRVRGMKTVKGKKQYTRWSNKIHVVYDYDI